MISASSFVSLKKLTATNHVLVAAKHNLRELQAEIGAGSHIDASRIHMNQILAGAGNAKAVAADAERLMHSAGVGRLRCDAVRAVELLISLPAASAINPGPFFQDALEWARRYFGVPVLSAVVHFDEANPHCHVLLLPLVNGRMVGSDLVGYKSRLQATNSNFFAEVGAKYGLVQPKAAKNPDAKSRRLAATMVLDALESDAELLRNEAIRAALLMVLQRDPMPVMTAMGRQMPRSSKRRDSFVEIMTRPCKPENPIGFGRLAKPRRIMEPAGEKDETLSCVGFEVPDLPCSVSQAPRSEPPVRQFASGGLTY